MSWQETYQSKIKTCEEIAAMVRSGDTLTLNICDNCPYPFLDALADRMNTLTDITISGIGISRKPIRLYNPEYADRVRFINFFFGGEERRAVKNGARISYQPVHLSRRRNDVSDGFHSRILITAASVPDENGFVSLGPNPIDTDLFYKYDLVVIQINEKLPVVSGSRCRFSLENADYIMDRPDEIFYIPSASPSETDRKIASYVVERIPDGACIQLGIGGMGTAIGEFLKSKKHLGIHTELFVDSMVDLIRCGAVDNSRKQLCPGKSEFGFALCSEKVANCLDHNPDVEGIPFSWINDPRIIAQNDNVISVNSAMEIDLTGQVAAEGVGSRQFSGTGGQADFIRGAKWSKGGKSFICIPSTYQTKDGALHSKISLHFAPGTPVTTPRADVQYIVTEYGIVNLEFCSLEQRASRLIRIAHPQFREKLAFEARKEGLL